MNARYRFLAIISGAIMLLGAGCAQLRTSTPRLPVRTVMVSTASGNFAVDVRTDVFPSGGGHVTGRIEGEGGIANSDLARPSTPPGISANADLYVAANWGGYPGYNALFLWVSEDGQLWSAAGKHLIAGSGQIDKDSRPSVTFFPKTKTWFVAFRDASNSGAINVAEFDVQCMKDARGNCQFDTRNGKRFSSNLRRLMNDIGPRTSRPPTISYLGDSVLIAFVETTQNAGSVIRIIPALNGNVFTGALTANGPSGLLRSRAGAPSFYNSLGTLFLATAEPAANKVAISVLRAVDRLQWVEVRNVPDLIDISRISSGSVDPAIAGPESEMTIAYPTVETDQITGQSRIGTAVLLSGRSTNPMFIATDTPHSVGISHGPGPN